MFRRNGFRAVAVLDEKGRQDGDPIARTEDFGARRVRRETDFEAVVLERRGGGDVSGVGGFRVGDVLVKREETTRNSFAGAGLRSDDFDRFERRFLGIVEVDFGGVGDFDVCARVRFDRVDAEIIEFQPRRRRGAVLQGERQLAVRDRRNAELDRLVNDFDQFEARDFDFARVVPGVEAEAQKRTNRFDRNEIIVKLAVGRQRETGRAALVVFRERGFGAEKLTAAGRRRSHSEADERRSGERSRGTVGVKLYPV